MSSETITKVKWFWTWQDEEEEEWLHQMALQGWRLSETGFPTVYKFRKDKPANIFYRLDYKSTTDKDMKSYLKLFEDAGWEHLGTQGGWQYFCKEVPQGEESEIFTDNPSKIQKYQRVQLILFIIMTPMIATLNNNSPLTISIFRNLVLILMVYSQVKLWLKIRSLKNS